MTLCRVVIDFWCPKSFGTYFRFTKGLIPKVFLSTNIADLDLRLRAPAHVNEAVQLNSGDIDITSIAKVARAAFMCMRTKAHNTVNH